MYVKVCLYVRVLMFLYVVVNISVLIWAALKILSLTLLEASCIFCNSDFIVSIFLIVCR